MAPQVFVYDQCLVLSAARPYDASSGRAMRDPRAHITNTAYQAEHCAPGDDAADCWSEDACVALLEDLVDHLADERLARGDMAAPTEGEVRAAARARVIGLVTQIHELTRELFRAFRGEWSVFHPLPGCFELYGLDFLVSSDAGQDRAWLLEVNPGPDFKQTGSRLKGVISHLIEDTARIVFDGDDRNEGEQFGGFTRVLNEAWLSEGGAAVSMTMY